MPNDAMHLVPMVLLLMMMMMMLGMLLMMVKLLILEVVSHIQLHGKIPTGGPPVHHGMLPLLVALIVHAEDAMRGRLRSGRSRGRRSVCWKGGASGLDGRAVSRQMAWRVGLLVLRVIELLPHRLAEPVGTICHLMPARTTQGG